MRKPVRIPKNGGRDTPLWRGLQFDDSALQPDRDGVGSVVSVKLGQDVPDVALDCFLVLLILNFFAPRAEFSGPFGGPGFSLAEAKFLSIGFSR
jgi:hypothetical protein